MKALTNKLRPLILVASGLFFYLVVLGVRGTGTAGLDLLEHMHAANKALMDHAPARVLTSPHPLVDLLAIPVAAVTHNPILAFGVMSALAVSLALPAVWRMAEAAGGPASALLATGIFLGIPMVAGAATTVGDASLVLLVWCWVLRLATKTQYRWWTTLLYVGLTAVLTLMWAPTMLWVFAWLIVVIAVRGFWRQTADPDARGMIGQTSVPLALVLAPVGVVVLPSLFFLAIGIHPDGLPGAWDTFLSHSLLADWTPVLFEGTTYTSGRPPLATGLVWMSYEFPPQVVIGVVAALILPATEHFGIFVEEPSTTSGFAMPRSFSVMTLIFIIGLPWALRTRTVGGVPIMLMAAPVLAILAGSILSTLLGLALEWLDYREAKVRMRRVVVGGLLGLFVLPGLLATVAIHPFEGSYYNWFAGLLGGAIAAGHPASRDDVLPVEVAESAAAKIGAKSLDAGPFRPHFEAYVRSRYIPPLNFADKRHPWKARFRERGVTHKKLEAEPATQVTWGPENVGVFILDLRN